MELIRIYALPLALSIGAALLLGAETHALQVGLSRGEPRWTRFWRRVTGALLIAGVGFMLHLGPGLPSPAASQDEVYQQFHYWLWVLGLVLIAVVLALWDVIDSMRQLKHHVETLERSEVAHLHEALRKRKR